jgi:hypothetical protein
MIRGVLLKKRKTHPFCIAVTVKGAQNRTHSKNSKAKKAQAELWGQYQRMESCNCDL